MIASLIFKKNFSERNLTKIYTEKIEGSGAIGLDRIKPSSLTNNISDEVSLISRKYHDGSYKFTAYKEKLISKGASSFPRQISIPTARDRITLRAICDSFAQIFPDAKLSLPQDVIRSLSLALESKEYSEYIKIDLQSFYPSIPHELIKKSLKSKIYKKEIRDIINKAIKTPTINGNIGKKDTEDNDVGVPQGLSISNILAEISLQVIDKQISSIPNIWYKRYVDDILILTKSGCATTLAKNLIAKLEFMGLKPHPIGVDGSKSEVATFAKDFSFLGYSIKSNQILVKKESILRFESSIAKILTAFKYNLSKYKGVSEIRNKEIRNRALAYCKWKLNLRITGCIFEGRRFGWVAYFSQISSTTQLRSLNHVIKKMLVRFGLENEIKIKSLIKAYYELRRGDKNEHKYIPNLDNLTIKQQREMLLMWLDKKKVDSLRNEQVRKMFRQKISISVKELEQDISEIS
ncbi:reverse transcriptase domain-containing protein [Proteus mirabilis]|nr:reverse transcriptase domain-containing protein [Proteus mirabilis]HEJ9693155.1 reverse transcriptase [Proteus mirabilis]